MTKKIIAFDLDDTLCIAKSPMPKQMSELMGTLLDHYEVCVISGGNLAQFKIQVLDQLDVSAEKLARLHLMPTCGTQYYRYNTDAQDWDQQYANNLTDEQKIRATNALMESAKMLGLWEENPYGEVIEDRGSQVTLSALGQQAPAEAKYAWDPTGEKKLAIRDAVAPLVPDLDARAGGTTSVDVTLKGVDKAYGIKHLIEATGVQMDEILFIGDKLEEGGNDYPVKAMGIDSIAVEKWQDTALVIETLNKVAK
jgi:HAD superfamily hydrolase (TIGR01484 family)